MRKDWPSDCTAAIEYDAELENLVSIARDPMWKKYAWDKAQGLEKQCPELWGGISEALVQRMKPNQEITGLSG